ncbi:MAG: Ig-like domain-containing protein [bacterium]|nr:Ig-like domain-containing protein [bacterium]
MKKWFSLFVLLSLFLIIACGNYEPPADPGYQAGDPVTDEIGIDGGSIQPETGVWELTVPQYALTADAAITVTEEQTPTGSVPAGFTRMSTIFKVEPEGLVFNKTATLKLTYEQTGFPEGEIQEQLASFYYINDDSTATQITSQFTTGSNSCIAEFDRFSGSYCTVLTPDIAGVIDGSVTDPAAVQLVSDTVTNYFDSLADVAARKAYYEANKSILDDLYAVVTTILGSNLLVVRYPYLDRTTGVTDIVLSPVDGAANVTRESDIVLTFRETVKTNNSWSVVVNDSNSGSITYSNLENYDRVTVSTSVTAAGNYTLVTIDPSGFFSGSGSITVTASGFEALIDDYAIPGANATFGTGDNYDVYDINDENGGNDSQITATDLGSVCYNNLEGPDTVKVTGFIYGGKNNVSDSDYFRFEASDPTAGQINFFGSSAPYNTKNFHVRIQFTQNPESVYGIRIWAGRDENYPSGGVDSSQIYGSFDWGLKSNGDIRESDAHYYTEFIVEVYKHEDISGTDQMYELEITNGVATTY